jgi:hypothetical protein
LARVDDAHIAGVAAGVHGNLEDRLAIHRSIARSRKFLRECDQWAAGVEAARVIAIAQRVPKRSLYPWSGVSLRLWRGVRDVQAIRKLTEGQSATTDVKRLVGRTRCSGGVERERIR